MSSLSESADWTHLRSLVGPAEFVPGAITRMVRATTVEEASSAYWELDNRVVVQGQLFEAAIATARAVSVAICEGEPSGFGLSRSLDLLVEIAAGEPDQSEIALGNDSLGDACRQELRRFLPCFRKFITSKDARTQLALLDLLDIVELDRERVREVARSILAKRPAEEVEARARQLASG